MLTDRQRDALGALGLASVRFDAPLAPWTRLGVGGSADALVEVPDPEALARLARWTRRERLGLTPVQRGTDAVVRDPGARGVVCLLGEAWRTELAGQGRVLGGEADALTVATGWDAPAWLGRGGTVATALVGNDAHGATGVTAVDVVLGRGVRKTVLRAELDLGDARLGLRDEAVVAAVHVREGEAGTLPTWDTQGVVVFRDPARGSTAAELLAGAGLLGIRIRGARLDDVVPGRLTTEDGATAKDVELLVDWARRQVAAETGVELESRLRWVGARR